MWTFSKLRLENWKSFKNVTDIPFGEGMNCLTGENGAGKSNVLDAISFALGEAPTHLRVKTLSELAGNKNQKVVVELFLHINCPSISKKKSFTTPATEFKSQQVPSKIGSSIIDGTRFEYYFVNGSRLPKHRFDETIIALGLHVGDQAIWRINQSEINRNISLKPDELFDCISQVSGTKLFNQRREDALKQIKNCKRGLAIVTEDINSLISEVTVEAKAIADEERFEDLKHELSEVFPSKISCIEYHQCSLEENFHNLAVDSKKNALIKTQETIALYENNLHQTVVKISEHQQQDETDKRVHNAVKNFEFFCASVEECREKQDQLIATLEALCLFRATLPELVRLKHNIESVEEPTMITRRNMLSSTLQSIDAQILAAQRLSSTKHESSCDNSVRALLQQDVLNSRKKADQCFKELQNLNSKFREVKKQINYHEKKIMKQQLDYDNFLHAQNEIMRSITSCCSKREQDNRSGEGSTNNDKPKCKNLKHKGILETELEIIETQLKDLRNLKTRLQTKSISLAGRLNCWFPSLQYSLSSNNQKLPGYYLFEKLEYLDGVNEPLKVALDSILSASLCVRVVDTTKEGLYFNQEARASKRGSRVWPLNSIDNPNGSLKQKREFMNKLLSDIGQQVNCVDPLSMLKCDRSDSSFLAIVKAVSNWVIAFDDDSANEILKLANGKLRVVTTSGNRHTVGKLVGGSNLQNDVSRENQKLAIADNLRGCLVELSDLTFKFNQITQRRVDVKNALEKCLEVDDLISQVAFLNEAKAASLVEQNSLEIEVTSIKRLIKETETDKENAEGSLNQTQASLDSMNNNSTIPTKQEMLAKLHKSQQDASNALEHAEQSLATIQDRKEMILEALKPDDPQVEECLSALPLQDSNVVDPQCLLEGCDTTVHILKDQISSFEDKLIHLESEKEVARQTVTSTDNVKDERRIQLHDWCCEKQRLEQQISDESITESSLQNEIENHNKAICKLIAKRNSLEKLKSKNKCVVTISDIVATNQNDIVVEHTEPAVAVNDLTVDNLKTILYSLKADENSKREELKLLRQNFHTKKRRQIETVNHGAMRAKQRVVDTLKDQIKSVNGAIIHLEAGIQDAIMLMKEANLACFKDVSANFEKQVTMLIPGRIGIMNPVCGNLEDGLSLTFKTDVCGDPRSMIELSGGQKALVGLALTFSLSLFRRLPIYILDEIDAPLDEHNQAVAAEAVGNLFYGSQVICISHHTPFHKIADHLIQITRENESSKVLGVVHQQ